MFFSSIDFVSLPSPGFQSYVFGLTWHRYNWTVFDVSGQFGVILASFFSALSVFPVVFLACFCVFLVFSSLSGACFFPLNFCLPLHARQWETKIKWKNLRPVFLKNNFEQHWGSASAVQNLSSKTRPWKHRETSETHRSRPERQQEKADRAEELLDRWTFCWALYFFRIIFGVHWP